MKLFIAFAALLALTASPIQAQRTVHGVVFDDANGNGALDRNEQPVPGVVVSNQLAVVTTDAGGRYQLPADEKTIVFVSVPTDWQPVGSSWRLVANSDSVSFGLRAERQPRSFRFIHASDTHIEATNVGRVRRFRALVQFLEELFAGRVRVWSSGQGGSGGWFHDGSEMSSSMMAREARVYTWSGPVDTPS